MKWSLAVLVLLGALLFALAHTENERCATTAKYLKELNDPKIANTRAGIDARSAGYVQSHAAAGYNGKRAAPTIDGDVFTIKVIFHVLYSNSAQNVADSVLDAQIDRLNADYRATNTDKGDLYSEFNTIAPVDTKIQFTKDRVIRKAVSSSSFEASDSAIKYSSNGGSDAIEPTKYLNFWICELTGGILGYAQFPGGNAETDGVVCTTASLPGVSSGSYDMGRTATHEIGHWLNLRHVWGDRYNDNNPNKDNAAVIFIDCCIDDHISDTPYQRRPNYGCGNTIDSCTGSNFPGDDFRQNYMDYGDDRCLISFSYEQALMMRAQLDDYGARQAQVTTNLVQWPDVSYTLNAACKESFSSGLPSSWTLSPAADATRATATEGYVSLRAGSDSPETNYVESKSFTCEAGLRVQFVLTYLTEIGSVGSNCYDGGYGEVVDNNGAVVDHLYFDSAYRGPLVPCYQNPQAPKRAWCSVNNNQVANTVEAPINCTVGETTKIRIVMANDDGGSNAGTDTFRVDDFSVFSPTNTAFNDDYNSAGCVATKNENSAAGLQVTFGLVIMALIAVVLF